MAAAGARLQRNCGLNGQVQRAKAARAVAALHLKDPGKAAVRQFFSERRGAQFADLALRITRLARPTLLTPYDAFTETAASDTRGSTVAINDLRRSSR